MSFCLGVGPIFNSANLPSGCGRNNDLRWCGFLRRCLTVSLEDPYLGTGEPEGSRTTQIIQTRLPMQRNRPVLIAAAGLVFVGDVSETGSLFGRPRPWWFLRSIYASISLVLASSVPEITRKALLLENMRLRIFKPEDV